MQRKTPSIPQARANLAAFLHEHFGAIERNDVGPLVGQAALLCERGEGSVVVPADARDGVNAALSSEAASPFWKRGAAPRVRRNKRSR
jgi:hypothetical protein